MTREEEDMKEYRFTEPTDLIHELMVKEGTNRCKVAQDIGMTRQNLYQMLNKGKGDLRVSSFLRIMKGMGYEVIVRKCEKI